MRYENENGKVLTSQTLNTLSKTVQRECQGLNIVKLAKPSAFTDILRPCVQEHLTCVVYMRVLHLICVYDIVVFFIYI